FVQLLLILAAVWRRPRRYDENRLEPVGQQLQTARAAHVVHDEPNLAGHEEHKAQHIGPNGWAWVLTLFVALVWVGQIPAAWRLYWLLIAVVALPWMVVMAPS